MQSTSFFRFVLYDTLTSAKGGDVMSDNNASPLPWTGNKSCIYRTLEAFFPPHNVYIEPCCGSAEVFLRKQPVEREILNDYNGDVVNFIKVIQGNKQLTYFLGRLCLSANAELIFKQNRELLRSIPNILDEITQISEAFAEFSMEEVEQAIAFFENQIYSFSSTGKTFGIAKRNIVNRVPRLIAAHNRLREATILHRDYMDAINYGACVGAFILLDPPYKDTEKYYQKSNFDGDEHAKLFEFMYGIHMKYGGECKFIITYNNDPYIVDLANKYGFYTYVKPRLHNMAQASNPGEMFEELLIANYDLEAQASANEIWLDEQSRQISLFDFKCDY